MTIRDRLKRLIGAKRAPGSGADERPGRMYAGLLHLFGPSDNPSNPLTKSEAEHERDKAEEHQQLRHRQARANSRRRRWNRWLRGRNPVPSYTQPPAAGQEPSPEADEMPPRRPDDDAGGRS